jgi:hypothetical protein
MALQIGHFDLPLCTYNVGFCLRASNPLDLIRLKNTTYSVSNLLD